MSLIKVSEATNTQLDWMVERAKGTHWSLNGYFVYKFPTGTERFDKQPGASYSTEWAQGGPIIERERLNLLDRGSDYSASYSRGQKAGQRWVGPTPLIAAMRCFVTSKLGDEVEVPEELT